jgi:hypothetical protein
MDHAGPWSLLLKKTVFEHHFFLGGTMNNLSIAKTFIFIAMSAALILITACSHAPFSERYQPGSDTIYLWQNEPIPLQPEWRYLGEETVGVRGEILDAALIPIDQIRSLIFVRGENPEFLILSQVTKTSQTEIFRYLGGSKTLVEGYPYRENVYGLSAATTDPEYRRYFEKIRAAGISPAPEYSVRVLDRLPVDTTLVRIMELAPGNSSLALPAYGKLYPQERLEPFPRRGF